MATTDILLLDDDASFASATCEVLEAFDIDSTAVSTLDQARQALAQGRYPVLLLDVQLDGESGLDLIEEVDPDQTSIVVMTGHPTMDVAVDSLRARVSDFLIKPVTPQHLIETVQRLLRSRHQHDDIKASHQAKPVFGKFVGDSPAMMTMYRQIRRVAASKASVFVQGESGTGKELVAEAIHQYSERSEAPFLALNCGAVASELIGSELFGHEKGSFTGAASRHEGYFERANGGTLFLDEVTEMPIDLQTQLLRVLETETVTRLGGKQPIEVNVRIVAATNRLPEEAIAEGKLREDLYYRLAVFPIMVPPLSERRSDIPLIAQYFLDRLNEQNGTDKRFDEGLLEQIATHRWQGNIRQLKNATERAYIMTDEVIAADDLIPNRNAAPVAAQPSSGMLTVQLGARTLAEVERDIIESTLDLFDGDKPVTAQSLGISLKTLYNRLNAYQKQDARKPSE